MAVLRCMHRAALSSVFKKEKAALCGTAVYAREARAAVEPISGIEPLTYSLRVNRSTD